MGFERITRTGVAAWVMAASVAGASATRTVEADVVDQIQRYCAVSWRKAGIARPEWSDCTQQAFLHLLERVARGDLTHALADATSTERRELNRAIWRTVQRWRRTKRHKPLDADAVRDHRLARESYDHGEEISQALDQLDDRRREILCLWSQGWSIATIADRLDLSAARCSDEKYKALRQLRNTLTPEESA